MTTALRAAEARADALQGIEDLQRQLAELGEKLSVYNTRFGFAREAGFSHAKAFVDSAWLHLEWATDQIKQGAS